MSNALAEIVADYIRRNRPEQRDMLRRMADRENIESALQLAVTYEYEGTRTLHPHQRRIGRDRLSECEKALRGVLNDLRSASSFEQVHARVNHVIGSMWRVGPLTVYDTSLRLGAFLGLYPDIVFLHTGALEGARKFGFASTNGRLQKSLLPAELQELEPYEIENFLCIYKRGTASTCQSSKSMC